MSWIACPVSHVLGHMSCCPCPGSQALWHMSCVTWAGSHGFFGFLGFVGLVGVRGARLRGGPCAPGTCQGLCELARELHEHARRWRGAPGPAFGSQGTTSCKPYAAEPTRCPAMCLGWRSAIVVLRLHAPCLGGCLCLAALAEMPRLRCLDLALSNASQLRGQ